MSCDGIEFMSALKMNKRFLEIVSTKRSQIWYCIRLVDCGRDRRSRNGSCWTSRTGWRASVHGVKHTYVMISKHFYFYIVSTYYFYLNTNKIRGISRDSGVYHVLHLPSCLQRLYVQLPHIWPPPCARQSRENVLLR